jgi:hypothetical protein
MRPKVVVKSANDDIKRAREAMAWTVINHFGNQLPDRSLLCFFDDENWQAFKKEYGVANRGVYTPVTLPLRPTPPDYYILPRC